MKSAFFGKLVILHSFLLASAYGSGAYNTNNYNGTNANSGLLPGTGGAVWTIVFSLLVIAALSLFFWLWQRRKHHKHQSPTDHLPS